MSFELSMYDCCMDVINVVCEFGYSTPGGLTTLGIRAILTVGQALGRMVNRLELRNKIST